MARKSDWLLTHRQLFLDAHLARLGRPFQNNVFLALTPPPETASQLHERTLQHCSWTSSPSRPHPAAVLHVSLLGLGRYEQAPARLVGLVDEAAGLLSICAFQVSFSRSAYFGGTRKHLVLTGTDHRSEIVALRRQLLFALSRLARLPMPAASFTPHLTLIYNCGRTPLMTLEHPISWLAQDFVLVMSIHGETRHEELGRWKLRPAVNPQSPAVGIKAQLELDLGRRAL